MLAGSLRDKLRSGTAFFALHSAGANPDLVEMLAKAGADAVYLDAERSPLDLGQIVAMRRAAHASGCPVLLRPHSDMPAELVRYLDAGVDGLICPRIENPADLVAIRETIRYARGKAADKTALVAQIESAAAVEARAALFAADAADAFFLGPNDIAWGMGLEASAVEVQDLLRLTLRDGAQAGRTVGLPVDPASVAEWHEHGARYFSVRLPAVFKGLMQQLQVATAG